MIRLIKMCAVLFMFTGCLFGNDWEIIGRMPVAVKGAQAVVQNSMIYVIGGYSDSLYRPVNIIQVFDPGTGVWQIHNDTLSTPRYGHAANGYGEQIILYGGARDTDLANQSLEFWDLLTPPFFYNYNPNFSRDFSVGEVFQDDLYLFGGFSTLLPGDTTTLPYMVRYHLPSGNVTATDMAFYTTENSPIHQMSALSSGYIYLFGGSSFGITRDIVRFSPGAQEWQHLDAALTEERAGGQAVTIDDRRIALIGGYNESNTALRSVELINFWSEDIFDGELVSPLNFERAEPAAVMLDSFIYVFGGCNRTGNCVPEVEKWLPDAQTTDITDTEKESPKHFRLLQNFPNPFNSSTAIPFHLSKTSSVILEIFSVDGKCIQNLMPGVFHPGTHTFYWDGKDSKNTAVPSGVYFYRLRAGDQLAVKRLLLVR